MRGWGWGGAGIKPGQVSGGWAAVERVYRVLDLALGKARYACVCPLPSRSLCVSLTVGEVDVCVLRLWVK